MKNRFISGFIVMASILNAQPNKTVAPLLPGKQNDSLKVEIENIGEQINSPFLDYAPLISADGSLLIFTSRRPLVEKKTKNLKDYIYYSNYDNKKMKWSDAIPFSDSINVPEKNNSAISISNNGQQMLIYRDDLNTNGDIYESHLSGSEWTEPISLGEPVNSPDKEPSACISPDGETIYFVSNRTGGLGGFDIWYCTKNSDGKWGEAINIGEPINSIADEDGLFINSDGKTLFFSSKGHNSMGGYDVFMSVLNPTTKVWSMPNNLGPSINTAEDDLYFVMEANGKNGYFSSSRPGGFGEKDIYHIVFIDNFMKTNLRLLKGIVIDEKGNPVESIITVIDKSTGKIIGSSGSNKTSGKYLITFPADKNYEIEVNADGYTGYKYSIDTSNTADDKEIAKEIILKLKSPPLDLQDTLTSNVTKVATLKTTKNINPSSGDLNPVVFGRVLDKNGNPLKVEIEVIDNNTNKVLGKYQNSITTGIFSLRIKGGNYQFVFSKPCYLFKSVSASTSNSAGYKKDLGDIIMEQVGIGKKIILNNILFDYTKATLREESFFTLDRTIRLMNSLESLEIEISGHTDNTSSASYNQTLSEERAKAVLKYLARMGIDEERLKSKGYGLSKPIANNNTEEGRQLNRRTELKVLNVDLEAEQIKEVRRLKEFVLADLKLNSGEGNLTVRSESNNNKSFPERFKNFDTENNEKISSAEIIPAIDSFLEGTGKVNADEIIALIDYYFEQ